MVNKLGIGSNYQCIDQNENLRSTCTNPQQITVILPAYEEEVSIGSIVLLTRIYADKVIVVDDGSSDRTADIARKAGAGIISIFNLESGDLRTTLKSYQIFRDDPT